MSFKRSFLLAPILVACMPVLFVWSITGAADPLASGTIDVRQTVQCCYREGSVSYVVVHQIGNDRATTRVSRLLAPLEPTLILGTELSPGRYVISSFQRPCDGNCDFLNPPIDQCSTDPIELHAGMAVSVLVSVVPFGGCSISTETESI